MSSIPTRTPGPSAPAESFVPEQLSWKVGIYGPEGTGKSSLAASCPGVVFIDTEYSVRHLKVKKQPGIASPDYAASWAALRKFIQGLNSGVYCIDSITRAEDWCASWVIKNKKSNEGFSAADSLEDFKYKAGITYVTDEFRRLLSDVENACNRGVTFILVAHNRINRIKNPDGSDFVQNQPRLLDDPKGSNMLQFVQFVDHLLFIDLDKDVNKGKVTSSGTRAIYVDTSANHISKSRTLPPDPIEYAKGSAKVWEMLGLKGL